MVRFDKTDDKKIERLLVRKAKLLANRSNRSLYVNVGIIGILGGIIIIPILIGIFIGAWIDNNYPMDPISWRLNLLFVGFALGLYYAYLWVKREGIEKADEQYREELSKIKDDHHE